jgi:hypothetical protein
MEEGNSEFTAGRKVGKVLSPFYCLAHRQKGKIISEI